MQETIRGHVRLPSSYFKKTLNEYADWKLAWVREILQNCYDAILKSERASGEIEFTFHYSRKGGTTATVRDTGTGMTLDILQNVLLSMGGSSKDGTDTSGGFGYAKNVLYFAQKSYAIQTNNMAVTGSGADYEIMPCPTPKKWATQSQVHFDGLIWEFLPNLLTMLNIFRPAKPIKISVAVQVDGLAPVKYYWSSADSLSYDDLEHDTVDTPIGKLKVFEEIEWIDDLSRFNSDPSIGGEGIQFNPSRYQGQGLWVRRKGQPLFRMTLGSGATVKLAILDLDESMDLTKTLTANRDGLVWEHQNTINNLLNKLTNEARTLTMGHTIQAIVNQVASLTEDGTRPRNVPYYDSEGSGPTSEQDRFSWELGKELSQLKWPYPENFVIQSDARHQEGHGRELINKLKQKRSVKLAHQWWTAVRYVMSSNYWENMLRDVIKEGVGVVEAWEDDVYHEFKINRRQIVPGFVFNVGVEGSCKTTAFNYVISMNPDELPDDYDADYLVDLAIHECAHIVFEGHGEQFSALTDLLRHKLRKEFGLSDIRYYINGVRVAG